MNTPLTDSNARAALLQRAADMLLRPADTWQRIAQEDGSPARIYAGYLVFLAAIPAVAGFIGYSLVGTSAFGIAVRVPFVQGLVGMVVGYMLSLAMVYVMALVANLLAPRFQGRADLGRALPLIAYGATAGMLGGVFQIVPALAMLGLLAALYTVYVICLGVPVLMEVPREKALGYTAALVVCGIVAALAAGLLISAVTPGGREPGSLGSAPTIRVPGTDIQIDTRRVEEASRKMEQAQARGDTEAASKAAGEMVTAALGGKGGTAFPPQQLREMLPAQLGDMPRTAVNARAESAMGLQFTDVSAQYRRPDGGTLEIQVQDVGGAGSPLAMALAGWARMTQESEDEEEASRTYRQGDTALHESWRKDGSSAELAMLLPNGIVLKANGSMDMATLKRYTESLHQQLAQLRRAG